MRLLLAAYTTLFFWLYMTACGRVHTDAKALSRTTAGALSNVHTITGSDPSQYRRHDVDGDNDGNNDDYAYGSAADFAQVQAVTELVKLYYADAASDDGGRACSRLYSLFAEEVVELYGETGPANLRANNCAEVASKLFRLNHKQLVADNSSLRVTDVRFKGHRGLAMLSFRGMPRRDIAIHKEYGTWKIFELLDSSLG